ncbi:MAG: hypothetical protein ACKO96_14715, partial [Flammeovirgaceae bacterium]
ITEDTLFLSFVKVFGHKTSYTIVIIPKGSSWTLADIIYKFLSSFAGLAFFASLIPKSIFGTDCASIAIKVGIVFGTFYTFLKLDIIDLIFGTLFT